MLICEFIILLEVLKIRMKCAKRKLERLFVVLTFEIINSKVLGE